MEFTFNTVYDQRAVVDMSRVLRKTLRKKRDRRARIFGWVVLGLGVLTLIPLGEETFTLDFGTVTTMIAMLVVLVTLLFEDQIDSWVARKQILRGADQITSVFREESFLSDCEAGKTERRYDSIDMLAETQRYFVFLFRPRHALLYDKESLTGGTVEQFRTFITEKTGKSMQMVK